MITIGFVNQKGGAGKSTLCQELAVCADLSGKKVAILDYDEQGSITQWSKDRESETPVVIPVSGKPLKHFVETAREKGYDYVFVDTAGKDSPSAYEAMEISDFCMIPLRARKKDIYPAKVNIDASMKLNKDLVFVLNHCPPVVRRELIEKAKTLGNYGTLCPIKIVNRVGYQDADDDGLSVLEYIPKSRVEDAIEEIKSLWAWVEKFAKKTNPTL